MKWLVVFHQNVLLIRGQVKHVNLTVQIAKQSTELTKAIGNLNKLPNFIFIFFYIVRNLQTIKWISYDYELVRLSFDAIRIESYCNFECYLCISIFSVVHSKTQCFEKYP